jgi:hypothetical protein
MSKKTKTAGDELAGADVTATAFNTPDEAILAAEDTRGLLAIELRRRWFTIAQGDAARLLKAKVPFSYVRDHEGEVYRVRAR